jgi:pyridoxal phosphate enzyme (YggS family)
MAANSLTTCQAGDPSLAARIAGNVAAIRQQVALTCQQCGRDTKNIRIIGVTKSQSPEVIMPLQANGICDLGENRLEHLETMRSAAPSETNFHFIGRIQGRQLAKIVPWCSTLHSLCDSDHIERLGRACAAAKRKMTVFLQVNAINDDAKAGVQPAEIAERLAHIRAHTHLQVVGLMTMAPLAAAGAQADEHTVRGCFAAVRNLAQQHHLPRLSMGMSHDYLLAIQEGATDIRIGTRLFI